MFIFVLSKAMLHTIRMSGVIWADGEWVKNWAHSPQEHAEQTHFGNMIDFDAEPQWKKWILVYQTTPSYSCDPFQNTYPKYKNNKNFIKSNVCLMQM